MDQIVPGKNPFVCFAPILKSGFAEGMKNSIQHIVLPIPK